MVNSSLRGPRRGTCIAVFRASRLLIHRVVVKQHCESRDSLLKVVSNKFDVPMDEQNGASHLPGKIPVPSCDQGSRNTRPLHLNNDKG